MESKHTQGKVFQSGLYFKQEDGSPLGLGQCFIGSYSPTGTGGRMVADGSGEANAERIVTLWNAMDGLTNEEVSSLRNEKKEILLALKQLLEVDKIDYTEVFMKESVAMQLINKHCKVK